jgi:uncharacterized membrane protein
MIFASFLHIAGFTIWVGGMFFAYMALRPVAAATLEPPQRLILWSGVFGKFFPWVWLAVALIFGSGFAMIAQIGMPPRYVIVMFGIGTIMAGIFAYLFFVPYTKLKAAVAQREWKTGGSALAQIRRLVGTNLLLGLVNVATGSLGPLAG